MAGDAGGTRQAGHAGHAGGSDGADGAGAFELRGINHLALVCRDMERTVDFYTNVLGMPLVKTIELPAGMGQHFFFDCGGGDCLAFFWFPDAPDGVPGISAPAARPDQGDLTSAVGSMNHVAFDVAPEKISEYRDRLMAAGIPCTEVANHDDSEWGISDALHPGVFVRSVYFQDPDGILLEFACWMRDFEPGDVAHAPARAAKAKGTVMAAEPELAAPAEPIRA
jgi:catechol 2,3-dioxygenase-like lactoylglutathione lyase family enzyme